MKHTKNILKSLLITVMALSLLSVSCKKDEGGSKPTDPIVTLGVADLNAIVTRLVQLQQNWEVQTPENFNPSSVGEGSISVKVTRGFTKADDLKTALSSNNPSVTVTANKDYNPTAVNNKNAAKFDITINIGNNNFAEDVKTKYTVSGKTAKLTLTITPTNKWDATN